VRTAHFTLAELPGTLSIWIAGIALGVALLTRDLRRLALPLALMAGIALTSMLGERAGWAESVQIGLDLVFLALAATCAWRLVARPGFALAPRR
jgi:hypothetical protein